MSTTDTRREEVIQYIRNVARMMDQARMARGSDLRYSSNEAVLLEKGRFWTPQRRPRWARRRMMKLCYANTISLIAGAWRRPLRYVEGIAYPRDGVLPVFHAWAVDSEDRVIDTTWPDSEQALYFGMPFDFRAVWAFYKGHPDGVGMIEGQYVIDFPLLRRGRITVEDVERGLERRDDWRWHRA